jgi:beta-galactosidase
MYKRCPIPVNPVRVHPSERRISLDGEWKIRLDPDDVGVDEGWFSQPALFSDSILVPGTWQGQGFGTADTDYVWDFRIETRTLRATYKGTGWYFLQFDVPEQWCANPDLNFWIAFGGVHPSAEIWLNGDKIGTNGIPFAPFALHCGETALLPKSNALIVRVHEENRELACAYNWQGNWSGLYRSVELVATGNRYLEELRLYPDVDSGAVRVKATIGSFSHKRPAEEATTLELTLRATGKSDIYGRTAIQFGGASEGAVDGSPDLGTMDTIAAEAELSVTNPALWSPDSPALYEVDAMLFDANCVCLDARSERIGFVRLSADGKHFCINGEPYYMRGSGEFLASPETASPDWNRDRWRRKLKTLREYGYNYVRCQTYCQTPEYLDAADEVGLLVQNEMGILGGWAGSSQWHVYQWPQPTPDYRSRLEAQWDAIVKRDVNHPSANIYCMSNEYGVFIKNRPFPFKRLAWKCYRDTKQIKPSAFVIWTDGGCDESLPGEFVNDDAQADGTCSKPVIQHEFQWWSSFPDVRNMEKYSGAVRPYAAEIALESAAKHGISHVLPAAVHNSQRLQYVEAREKMERCRRENPTLAGICHFNAMDTVPSPQGIIDEFFERKLVSRSTWRKTNGDTVVMIDLPFENRCFASGDFLEFDIVVSDFSHPHFRIPVIRWELTGPEGVVSSGQLVPEHAPYQSYRAGTVKTVFPETDTPMAATLRCVLKERVNERSNEDSREISNEWPIWVFPEIAGQSEGVVRFYDTKDSWVTRLDAVYALPRQSGGNSKIEEIDIGSVRLLITDTLNAEITRYLIGGGPVLLAAGEGLVRPMRSKLTGGRGNYFFTPPANYPPYEDGLNATIIKSHRSLGDFPHEGFADLQFIRMIGDAPPLDIEPLKLTRFDPIIRAVHTYMVGRSLGYLIEVLVGKGRLLICALDLDQRRCEARYLLSCLTQYLLEDDAEDAQRLEQDEYEFLVRSVTIGDERSFQGACSKETRRE